MPCPGARLRRRTPRCGSCVRSSADVRIRDHLRLACYPSHIVVDLSRIVVHHAHMGTPRFRESIRVRLPAGLYERLDQVARREERSHSEIVRAALRMALEREPEPDQRRGSPTAIGASDVSC